MNVHDFNARRLNGDEQSLRDWHGQVLLIVNVASRCGYTPQYTGLEALYQRYQSRGFAVLGFPCNQFMSQEPDDEVAIGQFCSSTYDVHFPMFGKVDVNGDNAHPLWQHLKQAAPGVLGTEAIKWNFSKFLIGRDGRVIARYAPATAPEDIAADIERALAETA